MHQQRNTKQKQVIETMLKQAGRPLLPKELLSKAQESLPQLGVATVFRTLKKMVDEGTAKVVCLPGDSPRYEPADLTHHHHFKCSECECVFDLNGCPGHFEKLLPEGFQLTDHEITLFGRCTDCAIHYS
ncbi:MAG: Fur family ferric uptake transcriptional regulator [Cellvibrionaceae bacterium]|jgi:Fur family ferric uptake transcriptional regulator